MTAQPTIKSLTADVGGLSITSKMPGPSWGISAELCNVGSRLVDVEGSTCSGCYALKNAYVWKTTRTAQDRRLDALQRDPERWSVSMAAVINRKKLREFRWHDSGDLQDAAHLAAIVRVAELTPDCAHWLPTREYELVKGKTFPSNLTVRASAHMIDGPAPNLGLPTSTVSSHGADVPADSHRCPAPQQGNECGDCRACWDPEVQNVDYVKH